MVAVTYGAARAAAPAPATDRSESRKGWFARFMDSLIEARLESAERELARHAHMLPDDAKFKTRRGSRSIGG